METLKFKVGDKVRVKSLEWYNKEKNENGEIVKGKIFVEEMSQFCNKILTIKDIYVDFYIVEENSKNWQDWMLEGEVVEDIKNRVLTKEVAQAVVRCTKYCLKNKEDNANLQKKLFEIGCKWANGDKEVAYEDCKYLYVDNNLNITMGDTGEYYMNKPFAELSVNDVFNIEIKDMDVVTKEMTQEEIIEFFKDTKILCTSVEETTKVQKKLFELGIDWNFAGKVVYEVFLMFIIEKHIESTDNISHWVRSGRKKIEINEILTITLKEEEKPKFDPKTLRPFDKVLVRDLEHEVWVARFFDYYENGFYYTSSSACSWRCCVPYCDETKDLHRTCDDAPDYYKNW